MPIDDKLLDQMEKDIEGELGGKRLTNIQRRALQMDRLMIMFMRQSSVDHIELEKVKKASIVLWMQDNPKVTVFLFSVYLIISAFVDFRAVLSKALGL